MTTYDVNDDGTLRARSRRATARPRCAGSAASRGFYYVSNTGSNNISGYRIDGSGQPTLIGPTGIVATTGAGPIDMATAAGGRFLYVETGMPGTVEEYRVERRRHADRLGNVAGLPVGQEGIAAS